MHTDNTHTRGNIVGPGFDLGADADDAAKNDVVMEEGDCNSSDEEQEALAEEREEWGKQFTRTTKDNTQPVPSVTWTLADPEKMPKSCSREAMQGRMGTKYPAEIINIPPGTSIDSLRMMANHLRPKEWLPRLVRTANKTLYDNPEDRNYRKTNECEMEAILGLMLAASVMGVGSFEECFSVVQADRSVCPPAAFGQFGITKNRALIIYRKSHLSDGPEQPAGADEHWYIDGPLAEFNISMANSYRSSYLNTMDESGPPWHGAEGVGNYNM